MPREGFTPVYAFNADVISGIFNFDLYIRLVYLYIRLNLIMNFYFVVS